MGRIRENNIITSSLTQISVLSSIFLLVSTVNNSGGLYSIEHLSAAKSCEKKGYVMYSVEEEQRINHLKDGTKKSILIYDNYSFL